MSDALEISKREQKYFNQNVVKDIYRDTVCRSIEVAPHLLGLANHLISRLPKQIRASQNIRAICDVRSSFTTSLDEAVDLPWIATDSQQFRNALLFDIDSVEALELWQDLPEAIRPHLILSPWSGRAHAILPLISPVCISDKGRQGPQIIADLAHRLMAAALKATALPSGSLVKNPWGTSANVIGFIPRIGPRAAYPELYETTQARGLCWHTIPGAGAVELKDVVSALAPLYWDDTAPAPSKLQKKKKKNRPEPNQLGRNCILFDSARFWAYDRVEKDMSLIHDELFRLNAVFFTGNELPACELRATAKSIARFMNNRFNPKFGKDTTRGRDRKDGLDLSLEHKLILSGKKSAEQNKEVHSKEILKALEILKDGNAPITQAMISKVSKVSIRTIKAYWNGKNQKVQNGALSGSGNGVAPCLSFLKEVVHSINQDIKKRISISLYIDRCNQLTLEMGKRGSRPQNIPALPNGYTPEAAQARRHAEVARRDCVRRIEKNEDRKAMKARRETRLANMAAWANARDTKAFEAFHDFERSRWEALEIFISPEEMDRLRTHRTRMYTMLKRVREEWRQAKLKAARRGIFRTELDQTDRELAALNLTERTEVGADMGPNRSKRRFIEV